jgi:glycosyltransferase involved in cell wall biosynthesis
MAQLIKDTARSIPAALRVIRTERPELVYVSTLTIPSWLALGRITRRRVVCHVHESERTANRWVRKALAAPLWLAHRVVVNSRFSLGALTSSWPRLAGRSVVVYNGVPGPAEVIPGRSELTSAVRLLFVGRLSPRKGPQLAVDAVAVLRDRGIEARLDIVGSVFPGYEWFETELREQVTTLRLDDLVTLHGFREDVWNYLARADLMLVPSQGDEPFGNTAVEAALAARPVVVSANSGLDEAVAGFAAAQRVAPDDLDGWVNAISNVVDAWAAYRDKAIADREHAVETYAPAVYRRRMATELGVVAERTGEW